MLSLGPWGGWWPKLLFTVFNGRTGRIFVIGVAEKSPFNVTQVATAFSLPLFIMLVPYVWLSVARHIGKGWKVYNTESILCCSWSKWDLAHAVYGFGCVGCFFFLFVCVWWLDLFVCLFFPFLLVVCFCLWVFCLFSFGFCVWCVFLLIKACPELFTFECYGWRAVWFLTVLYRKAVTSLVFHYFETLKCFFLSYSVSAEKSCYVLDNWVKSVRPEVAGHYGRKTPKNEVLIFGSLSYNSFNGLFCLFVFLNIPTVC